MTAPPCITCGYWAATDGDQCEACATPARARLTPCAWCRQRTAHPFCSSECEHKMATIHVMLLRTLAELDVQS